MKREDYVRTRQGQVFEFDKRRQRRVRVLLGQQPQSKNINTADAIAFQEAVLERLKATGKRAYRGEVFLQLDFCTSEKDPPAITPLPKNHLDLLGNLRDGSGIDLTHLLIP